MRRQGLLVLCLILIGNLVIVGYSSFEIHAHEDAVPGHRHAQLHDDQQVPASTSDAPATWHVHEGCAAGATLVTAAPSLFEVAPGPNVSCPFAVALALASPPPPHRPPIA